MSQDLKVQVNGFVAAAAESQEAGRWEYEARMRPWPGSRAWRKNLAPAKQVRALLPSVATASMELRPNPTRRWGSHRRSEPQSRRAATGPDDCGLGRHSRVQCRQKGRGWGWRGCILCGLENEKHEWKQIIHEKKASESVLRSLT